MMKKCRFNDPDYLSLYYDGALDGEAEKKFSEHIMTCKECSAALLALERDLFLMKSMKLEDVPEGLKYRRAVFRLAEEGLRIIKNLAGPVTFVPLELKATLDSREEGEKKRYRLKTDSVVVDVFAGGGSMFSAEITGTAGKSLSLYLDGKKIEAHGHVAEPGVLIDGLGRGRYSLMVDERLILEFDVE
jgi:Fe-S oxidoreductase